MKEISEDLNQILQDVKDKTGVEVSLSPAEGATAFPLEFRGREREAYLSGEVSERVISLVRYLVKSADARDVLPDKEQYLKMILLGEGGSWHAFRFITRFRLRDGACFAVDILPERRVDEAALHLERCIEGTSDMVVKMDEKRIAVVKFSDEAPLEFAHFLAQTLYEDLGVKASVGVGCVAGSFSEIALSYTQAVTAVRMSAIFRSKGEVHSYREYLLVRLLEDVPKNRLKEYLDQFRLGTGESVFGDEEMIATAEAFLENNLNLSETSRNLFMHRNTLSYRLDKIERETGLNIRNFSDAVTFRVISILYRLLKS